MDNSARMGLNILLTDEFSSNTPMNMTTVKKAYPTCPFCRANAKALTKVFGCCDSVKYTPITAITPAKQ